HHMDIFGDEEVPPLPEDPTSLESGSPTVVEKRKVTLKQAEDLLQTYRAKASFFPFVKIAPEATVPSLSRTSPFLLLAILTSASIQDPLLHHQINHEFRRVLSSQVLLQGQRSLDFLQGLLVYIAWYPAHVNPRDTTSFMYMNLAISLLIDLGLDQETPSANKSDAAVTSTDLVEGDHFTEAARRTYLGCYYMSSAINRGFRKPNNRNYRDLLDKDSEGVMNEEFLTEIGSTVKLQRLVEMIGDVNALPRPAVDPRMEALNDEVNIQMFLDQLQEWQKSTPEHIRNQVHSVVVMSRLTFAMASKLSWNAETTRSQVPLVMYLDCLCYRFQVLSSVPVRSEEGSKHPDVYHVFQMILGSVKKSYEKRISKLVPEPPIGNNYATGHCPMMDYSLNVYFDPLVSMDASSFDLSGSGTPSIESTASSVHLYHDLWATMTGSWAEEI
ncbi:hypothetical protein BKA65DRAFT_398517, partial [Rhexocercosporidium sp. MPI-PUGE-AT-0058]